MESQASSPIRNDPRKRYSGLQLQYGLPTPNTSPTLDGGQWTPIEQRVNALAEVQRLQERFAELARLENARILGTTHPPRDPDAGVQTNSTHHLQHRKRHSLLESQLFHFKGSHAEASSTSGLKLQNPFNSDEATPVVESDPDCASASDEPGSSSDAEDGVSETPVVNGINYSNSDEEDDDEGNKTDSILMVRARDLESAVREARRRSGVPSVEDRSLQYATDQLLIALRLWFAALFAYVTQFKRQIAVGVAVATVCVVGIATLWPARNL